MLKKIPYHFTIGEQSITFRFFLLHFFFWLLFLFLPVANYFVGNRDSSADIFIKTIFSFGIFYLNYFILVPKLLLKRKLLLYFIIIAAILVVFTYIFSNYFDHFSPPKEMKEVIAKRLPRMKKPERGLFFMRFFPNVVMIILHLAFSAMFKIYVEWNDSFKKQKEAETEKKISELNFLKTQLNPHFFFNSLNTIFSLAIKKSDKTSVAVLNLSDLMRYMLYETNKEMVSLNEELLYIENYIELQKLRLTENNKIKYEVIGNSTGIMIPPLLFISFIENAFKHGISTATNSEIYIKFNISKKEINFFIVNDINKQPKNDEASGLGMENTLKRLSLYFPESHTLKTYVEDNKFYVDLNLKLDED